MKSIGLLGMLIAVAVGSITMWQSTSRVIPNATSSEPAPIILQTIEVKNQANERVAEMEETMKQFQEMQQFGR